MKILLIETNPDIIANLSRSLSAYRYVVDAVTDGETGWTYATTFEYDLIVLETRLPKLDGFSFCQRFRDEGYLAPILFLSEQDEGHAKVKGLDAGADDYVVKPFDHDELCARIRALLRRGSPGQFPQLAWGDLVLNPSTCEVTYCDRPLTLTTKEYELLELFLRDGHCVYSAEEILDRLWSSEDFPAESTVRSHLRRLRQKLSAAGAPPDFIATLHGRGYYLKSNPETLLPAVLPSDASVPVLNSQSLPQEQVYQDFFQEIWSTARAESLEQIDALLTSIEAQGLEAVRTQAQVLAHKLLGTLGIFMSPDGIQSSRNLEYLLEQPLADPSVLTAQLKSLSSLIHAQPTLNDCQPPSTNAPLLLIVNLEEAAVQPLVNAAACAGLRTAIAPTDTQAQAWLQPDLNRVQQPDVILLQMTLSHPGHPAPSRLTPVPFDLGLLQELARTYTEAPILVIAAALELSERLEVVQHGATVVLEHSIKAEEAVLAVQQCLSNRRQGVKVMIVDDDQALLRTLPSLLNPWGFKVSTLAAPEQFWPVLEAVNPDALVLDVKMPHINGLELCQVLRSDLKWRQLPVLFLSAVSNLQTQQQAFIVGADDYICKPITGIDLAHRILNRLQRHRSWRS